MSEDPAVREAAIATAGEIVRAAHKAVAREQPVREAAFLVYSLPFWMSVRAARMSATSVRAV
jgi:hypothetical protein